MPHKQEVEKQIFFHVALDNCVHVYLYNMMQLFAKFHVINLHVGFLSKSTFTRERLGKQQGRSFSPFMFLLTQKQQ